MTDSIQPDNRSALQMAIEQALDQMIGDIDAKAPLPQLLDGMKTPKQFLPSLAIERGVIDLSPGDSEDASRKTVDDSLTLTSHSCTPYGIDESIGALGYKSTTSLVRGYVFQTIVDAIDQPVDEEALSRIERRVSSYRAARDSTRVIMSRSAVAPMHMGAAVVIGETITVYPYEPGPISVSGQFVFGAALHVIECISVSSEAGDFHFNKWAASVEDACSLGF